MPVSKLSLRQLPWPVLLYFGAIAVPVHFHAGPLYLTTVRLFLLVAIAPLTIGLFRGKYGNLISTDILFILFLVWMTISLAQNNSNMLITQLGSMGLEFFGGYLLGRAYIRDEQSFKAMIYCMLLIILMTIPFAIQETITGRPIIIETIRKIPGLSSEPIVTYDKRWGLERVQVMLAHPIHYGMFCSAAFSLVFVGLKGTIRGSRRIMASLAILTGVFLSLSSGALLSIVLQFAIIFWAWTLNMVKTRWVLLIGFLIMAYVMVDLLSNRAPLSVFMSYATFSAHNAYYRSIIFEWGMYNVWNNPIFGLGFNDWVRPSYMHSGSMDNFWLVMAVRYGIPGFLILTAGYFWALWRVALHHFEEHTPIWRLRRGWIFTFIGLTFTLATVHIWTTAYSFIFFLFGAGMWFITTEVQKNNPAISKVSGTSKSQNHALNRSRTEGNNPAAAKTSHKQTASSQSKYTRF